LDPEPEPELEDEDEDEEQAVVAQRGYDVGHHNSEDEEESLGASALLPGSDIF
jgi:hypothetical protein